MIAPFMHPDGRRTSSNFVECLLGDVRAVFGKVSDDDMRILKNRFHAALKADRRMRERFSKKRAREIGRIQTRI